MAISVQRLGTVIDGQLVLRARGLPAVSAETSIGLVSVPIIRDKDGSVVKGLVPQKFVLTIVFETVAYVDILLRTQLTEVPMVTHTFIGSGSWDFVIHRETLESLMLMEDISNASEWKFGGTVTPVAGTAKFWSYIRPV